MHIRALITLALALILGGITVFLINHYLQSEVTSRAESRIVSTTPIVVAAVDMKYGKKLEKVLLKTVDWPSSTVPRDAYTSIDELLGKDAPIVLTEIHAGEPMLPYKLSPHGARGGLPAKIPEDKRAITIAVNEVKGVAGFIMPGDYVDVLHSTNVGRRDKQMVTRIVLQNVQVLGIDQISTDEDDKPRVVNAVTLLVTLHDAQRLTLAQHLGELNLVLRNEFDANLLEEVVVTYNELLTVEPEREVKVTKRARRMPYATKSNVEVIRGLEITKQKVTANKDSADGDNTDGSKTNTEAPAKAAQ